MPMKNHLVHLTFTAEELRLIDHWQDQHGIRTRSEAIRQMVRKASQVDGDTTMQEESGAKFRGRKAAPTAPDAKELQAMIQKLVQQEIQAQIKKQKK